MESQKEATKADVSQDMLEEAVDPLSDYAESEPEVEVYNQHMEESGQDCDPQQEPAQEDIDAWMSPRQARAKQLQLNGQYRVAGKLRAQNKTKDGTIDKLRAKNAKLKKAFKFERMRRLAAEKTMNDILKMFN